MTFGRNDQTYGAFISMFVSATPFVRSSSTRISTKEEWDWIRNTILGGLFTLLLLDSFLESHAQTHFYSIMNYFHGMHAFKL